MYLDVFNINIHCKKKLYDLIFIEFPTFKLHLKNKFVFSLVSVTSDVLTVSCNHYNLVEQLKNYNQV